MMSIHRQTETEGFSKEIWGYDEPITSFLIQVLTSWVALHAIHAVKLVI